MNNRIQQRFDSSIRKAIEATELANARKPRRDLTEVIRAMPTDRRKPHGRLYLCPETGATVWEPSHPQTEVGK